MKHTLYISDVHLPHEHHKALDFCQRIRDRYHCTQIIQSGDMFDHQGSSFHTRNPDLPSAYDEMKSAMRKAKLWHSAFPGMTITRGNHDAIPARQLEDIGLPSVWLTDPNKVYGTPTWKWCDDLIIPGGRHKIWFKHSWAASTVAKGGDGGYSICGGHVHTKSQIIWSQYPSHSTFSLVVGCMINPRHRAFNYNKHDARRPILSVATIIDGEPQLHRLWE